MPPVNRIITRGMGTTRDKPGRTGMISQGYGGIFREALEKIRQVIRVGQSGAKRALRELDNAVVVWAKLISVNDKPPVIKVEGTIHVNTNPVAKYVVNLVEHVSTRVRKTWEDIKISISRLR